MNSLTLFPAGLTFDSNAQAEPQPPTRPLLGFLVRGVLSTEPTKLIELQTPRRFLLIFGRGIVFPLTIPTSQMNYISHNRLTFNGKHGQQNNLQNHPQTQ
jgi:hypothetical protein